MDWFKSISETNGFLVACVRFIQDPTRTEEVFVISDHFAQAGKMNLMMKKLAGDPLVQAQIGSGYRPAKIDLNKQTYKPNTLGHAYVAYLHSNNFDPNFYENLPITDEINFIRSRLRETHDFWHVIFGFKTDNPGETGLAAAYAAQLSNAVMSLVAALFLSHGVLYDQENISSYFSELSRGWAIGKTSLSIIGRRWEEELHRDLTEIRNELGIGNFFGNANS